MKYCWSPTRRLWLHCLQVMAKPSCCPPPSDSFPWGLFQFLFGKEWESISARKCRRVMVTSARVTTSCGRTIQSHYPNTTVIIEPNDKEEVKSFRAPEATREIFKAAKEQSFHRSLAVWWDNMIQTKDSSRTTCLMPGNHSKHMGRKSLTFILGSSCILCFKWLFALFTSGKYKEWLFGNAKPKIKKSFLFTREN